LAGVAAGALVFAVTNGFDRAAGLTTAAATTAAQPIAGRSLDLARVAAEAASSGAAIVPDSLIAPPPRAPKRARPPRVDDRPMPPAPVSTAARAEPVRAASARVVDDYGY
jgi:hypothetical protein